MTPGDSGMGRVLKNRVFLRLWLVQALSQTAQNMIFFSLLILVRQIVERQNISQSNTAISLLVLAFSVPAVIFSPVAGVIIDRTDKRMVMVVSNGLRVIAVLVFLALDPAWPAILTLAALYAITFSLGAIGQFFGPAQLATIPVIVRPSEVIGANALFNLTFTAAQLLGFAAVGPIFIKLFGVNQTLVGILFLFIITTGLAMLLPPVPPTKAAAQNDDVQPFQRFVGEAREGIGFIRQRPILVKAIMYLSLATTTYLMIAALGPEFIVGVLKLPAEDIAYIVAPAGLGVVGGALFVSRVTRRVPPVRLVDVALIAAGTVLTLFAITEPVAGMLGFADNNVATGVVVLAVIFAALLGISNAFILVPSQALMQLGAPKHGVARVYATYFAISNIASFTPVLFAGAIADLVGVLQVMIAIGLILVGIGIYNLRRGTPAMPLVEEEEEVLLAAGEHRDHA